MQFENNRLYFQIEYKLNSMQMKFLRLLSKSAYQEMSYSCVDSVNGQEECVVDLKGENEAIVNNLDKINLNVTEVGPKTTDKKIGAASTTSLQGGVGELGVNKVDGTNISNKVRRRKRLCPGLTLIRCTRI